MNTIIQNAIESGQLTPKLLSAIVSSLSATCEKQDIDIRIDDLDANRNAIAQALPSAFTMDDLANTSGARGKSRAYLHQIINRWKKAGVIKSAGRAKYERV